MKKSLAVVLVVILALSSSIVAPTSVLAATTYKPSAQAAKYITEAVSAKLFTADIYNVPFNAATSYGDALALSQKLYDYIGGVDSADFMAKFTTYANGSSEESWEYIQSESVGASTALALLAETIFAAKPGELAKLPNAEAARATLASHGWSDTSIGDDDVRRIAYLYNADVLKTDESYGSSWQVFSRETIIVAITDAAWVFAKAKISPFVIAVKAATAPAAMDLRSGGSFYYQYKNAVRIWWDWQEGAYQYRVKVYLGKKLKSTVTLNASQLSLGAKTTPTYKSVFGNLKADKAASVKVVALDRHGVQSKKTLTISFVASKHTSPYKQLFSRTKIGFKSKAAAKKAQKSITVKVWKVNASGKKYKSKVYLAVNKAIAADVKKIFAAIYKGKEKFPVQAIGGYEARAGEHGYGTAIDINPTQNYMVDYKSVNSKGKLTGKRVMAGKFWKPGKSKYSIKANGDVVKAFAKYGWYWAGKGWSGGSDYAVRKDYMHFSLLST